MTAFDPNFDPETQEQADAYVTWCAENFTRLVTGSERNYRTALRSAQWLLVIATAQIHLHEDVHEDREALLEQLALYSLLARAIERQRQHTVIDRLVVLRSSFDCWEAVGDWAEELLSAAKCAAAALVIIEQHPLVELWSLSCPDVWALLDAGSQSLGEIDVDTLTFEDFSVRPADLVTAKFTWQRANNIVRHVGGQRLSEN